MTFAPERKLKAEKRSPFYCKRTSRKHIFQDLQHEQKHSSAQQTGFILKAKHDEEKNSAHPLGKEAKTDRPRLLPVNPHSPRSHQHVCRLVRIEAHRFGNKFGDIVRIK